MSEKNPVDKKFTHSPGFEVLGIQKMENERRRQKHEIRRKKNLSKSKGHGSQLHISGER